MDTKTSEIDHIVVDVAHRSKGYGRILVAHGANKSLQEGHKRVALWVVDTNLSAKQLYLQMGFEVERSHQFCIQYLK